MLALQRAAADEAAPRCTPHLLPCRIDRNGPVNALPRFWSPEVDKDGHFEAYFRGRKLKGKEVRIPEGYSGVVVKAEAKPQVNEQRTERMVAGIGGTTGTAESDLKLLEEVGQFDEIMIWGHETMAEGDDVFVKGLSEWIGFAESIHGYKTPGTQSA